VSGRRKEQKKWEKVPDTFSFPERNSAMLNRIAVILIAASLAAPLWPVQGNVPRMDADAWKVAVQPRMPYPSKEIVLRALPNGPPRQNVRIRYEVQLHRVGPAQFYPLVGAGRLVEAHFKCIVTSNRGREVVNIHMSRLAPAK
jgi:hypothetical protein